MASKKVFVSFDWDNDRHYKYLLEAWHANPEFDFVFSDTTPREIDSFDVGLFNVSNDWTRRGEK